VDSRGAIVLLKPQETAATYAAKQLTNLIRVGGKLAVLGVEEGARARGWWHVLRPGSFTPPQGLSGAPDQEGRNLCHGRALCGLIVVSNGYSSDWKPPVGQLCPACAEQI
jgi:hypothetical protein